MAAEITRHGGKIEKYIGDAIMAVFGLPRRTKMMRCARCALPRHAGGAEELNATSKSATASSWPHARRQHR